jgi:hypothetical protein
MRCLRTGKIRDLPTAFDSTLIDKLDPSLVESLQEQGFSVVDYRLELLGYFDERRWRRGPKNPETSRVLKLLRDLVRSVSFFCERCATSQFVFTELRLEGFGIISAQVRHVRHGKETRSDLSGIEAPCQRQPEHAYSGLQLTTG